MKISKVNTGDIANGRLNGSYCITHKVDGISTTEEDGIKLTTIDLQGLTDVVALDTNTLKELEPRSNAVLGRGEGGKSGLFDVTQYQTHPNPFLAKIRRKAYLPFCASDPKYYPNKAREALANATIFAKDNFQAIPFNDPSYNLVRLKNPQEVNWSFGGKTGTFYL